MAEVEKKPYIKFGDRPEFQDVTPVLQDDGPFPVCPIAYNEQFVDTMNYFRAMIQKNERSKRSLDVTTEVILLNPANYTAWYYRRLILESIKYDYYEELEFITQVALDNPKNYQIWHHRHVVVDTLKDPSKELEFTAKILSEDSKNYHAWSHRMWVIRTFGLWENELKYCEDLLTFDVRNNSAWNQKYFVVKHFGLNDETIFKEIQYTKEKICKAPNNESAWNYLIGLTKGRKLSEFPVIEQFCDEKKDQWVTCSHVLVTLIECYEEDTGNLLKIKTAIEYCDKLIGGMDDIHKKYWIWRKSLLVKLLQ